MDTNKLVKNVDKLYATELDLIRIRATFKEDVYNITEFCKNIILDKDTKLSYVDKMFFAMTNNWIVVIRASDYRILRITPQPTMEGVV